MAITRGQAARRIFAPNRRGVSSNAGSETASPSSPCRTGHPIAIGDVQVSFHPAGHILGSAQIRIAGAAGVWVVAGDYKRAADPTCAPFETVTCDTFVTESTFALPIYRWDHTETIVSEIMEWWTRTPAPGEPPRSSVTPPARHNASSPSWRASLIGRPSSTGLWCR